MQLGEGNRVTSVIRFINERVTETWSKDGNGATSWSKSIITNHQGGNTRCYCVTVDLQWDGSCNHLGLVKADPHEYENKKRGLLYLS